jgi:hypothetical protein
MPMITVIKVMPMENSADASISPNIIASTVIGVDASRSRVFADPSQGNIAGDTAVAVKKSVIPTSPAIRKDKGICLLPMKKARNKNNGIIIPKMRTGPFK